MKRHRMTGDGISRRHALEITGTFLVGTFVSGTSAFAQAKPLKIGIIGTGRIGGALICALLIAVFESVVAAWLSQPVAEAALYVALLGVLFLRPGGILGEVERRRA